MPNGRVDFSGRMKRRVIVPSTVCSLIAALLLALTASAVAKDQPAIHVNDVEELYLAVNNPANSGAVVVLASGIYTLTTKDVAGQLRPHGGRLVLQSGMALAGQNEYVDSDGDGIWDPRDDSQDGIPDTDPARGLIFADPRTETIINAVNLSGGQGALRIGLDNVVEKLTVRNTGNVGAAIDVNLAPAIGGMRAQIRDCLLEDGKRGIRMQHSQLTGVDSSAVLERNISRRHNGPLIGFGAQIQNAAST